MAIDGSPIARARVLEIARVWLGTPYHHQAAVRGAGCDCLGLVRGVWRDLYEAEPETPPPYSPDWGEYGEVEYLLDAAKRHMEPIAIAAAREGDVLAFRMRDRCMAKHLAIKSGDWTMIHAQSDDRVREVALSPYWRRHIVAAFAFPGVEP
ncbi:NlpC/P60 family putative phage cell wall peptidase [Methylosinus sp. sav-2]|nr:NlpC/P60 family putative phage cell wall peptidase [Methylosinus sp. sav-2]